MKKIELVERGNLYEFKSWEDTHSHEESSPFLDLEQKLCSLFSRSPRYEVDETDDLSLKTIKRCGEDFINIETDCSKTVVEISDSEHAAIMGGLLLTIYAQGLNEEKSDRVYLVAPYFKNGNMQSIIADLSLQRKYTRGRTKVVNAPAEQCSKELSIGAPAILLTAPFDRNAIWLMAGAYFKKDSLFWNLFHRDFSVFRQPKKPNGVSNLERFQEENKRLAAELSRAREELIFLYDLKRTHSLSGRIDNTVEYNAFMGQLQLAEDMERTGEFMIGTKDGSTKSTFYFQNGRIVQAELTDSAGEVTGEKAIQRTIVFYLQNRVPMEYGFIPKEKIECDSLMSRSRSAKAELVDCMRIIDQG